MSEIKIDQNLSNNPCQFTVSDENCSITYCCKLPEEASEWVQNFQKCIKENIGIFVKFVIF